MRKSKFTEEQMVAILKEQESGISIEELVRKHGINSHNQYWITSIEDVATLISKWKHDYNTLRPHSALGNMTPLQFRLAAEEANRLLKENKLDLTGNIKLATVS